MEFDNTDANKMFQGLGDDKHYGLDKETEQLEDGSDKLTKEPADVIHPLAFYANNLEELFMYKVNKNF